MNNVHSPPSESEVRATLWKQNQRLEARVSDLRTQRADLAYYMQRLLDSLDGERPTRDRSIADARKTLTTIRESMETE